MTAYAILDRQKRRYVRFGHLPSTTNNPRKVIPFQDAKLAEQFIAHNLKDHLRLRYSAVPLGKREATQ